MEDVCNDLTSFVADWVCICPSSQMVNQSKQVHVVSLRPSERASQGHADHLMWVAGVRHTYWHHMLLSWFVDLAYGTVLQLSFDNAVHSSPYICFLDGSNHLPDPSVSCLFMAMINH